MFLRDSRYFYISDFANVFKNSIILLSRDNEILKNRKVRSMTQNTQNSKISKKNNSLSVINAKAAGIDIGANSIFVCAIKPDGSTEVKEFGTFTNNLKMMAALLKEYGITSVAMESTGVYWIPVYDVLEEEGFDVVLVNAHYVKMVPGRKTDVKDCEWLQKLHSHGLLRGSFRPEGDFLTLRGYTRNKTNLVEMRSMQLNLMHKAMTQMNIQLRQVVSDIDGETGMKIIRSIVAGERNPVLLAKFRDRRCKKSEAEIAQALEGNYREEHIFTLKQALELYDVLCTQVIECDAQIERHIMTWENYVQESSMEASNTDHNNTPSKKKAQKSERDLKLENMLVEKLGVNLTEIPGLSVNSIMKLISEIGSDMSRFPTVKAFVSWLALCPDNKISGGKILSSKTRPSANKAAQVLRLAALATLRSDSALGAFARKMRGRLGAPKAITATAHKIAKILYHMLRDRTEFRDVGQAEFERRHHDKTLASLKRKADALGYNLTKRETVA